MHSSAAIYHLNTNYKTSLGVYAVLPIDTIVAFISC